MTHVILGLLLIAPQSLYGLVKSFEAGVALFYSSSSGSIKRALDVLLGDGRIEIMSIEPGGRGKKVYRTTEAGRQDFRRWMTGELSGPDLEAAVLPRLFFLGLLEPGERAPVLERIRRRADAALAELTALQQRTDAEVEVEELSPEHREVLVYQQATLEFGIASARHAVTWFGALADSGGPVTAPGPPGGHLPG